jgi:hypothetical protein
LSMNPFQCFLPVQVGPSRQSPRLSSKGLARLVGVSFLLVVTVFSCAVVGGAEDSSAGPAMFLVPELQTGFRFLYEQKFPEARETFVVWERQHPDEPFSHVAVAASYLFEEFYRQGVLSSDFFLDDKKFLRGIDGTPDPVRLKAFYAALDRTRVAARARMKTNPNDPEALFSLTLASGMQGDALSILEHKQFESLTYIKEADTTAEKLLAQRPDVADAWVALGAAHYTIGCLSRPMRFVLSLGGIHGDRKLGMEELSRTASDGRYMKPYAKILLALAARRERQDALARNLLRQLNEEFPESPLFAIEYSRVTGPQVQNAVTRQ